jgi:ubiquinone/menaquinone biosynthesis C-methylase UbiE
MSDQNIAFVGSIPENYDRYLGPACLEPYAADIVGRLIVPAGAFVLELACGTGIVTRRLRDRLPKGVRLVATDLSEAMISYAVRKFNPEVAVEWRQADAADLPFEDKGFDAVVCQFGLMFVPNKAMAVREAYRVLAPGGTFLFNVWDSMERNDLARVGHAIISAFFEHDPPDFYEIPFGFHDPKTIQSLLADAGFKDVEISLVQLPCASPSALDAAKGLVEGNPVIITINERSPGKAPEIVAAVADAIAAHYGDKPVRCSMQAYVCKAVR